MQQNNLIPISQANTVLYLLEQTADRLAAISLMFMTDEPLLDTAKRGAVEIVGSTILALHEATDNCEIVRDYLSKRAEPIESSMTEFLKDWIDKADDETRKKLVLSFCKVGEKESHAVNQAVNSSNVGETIAA